MPNDHAVRPYPLPIFLKIQSEQESTVWIWRPLLFRTLVLVRRLFTLSLGLGIERNSCKLHERSCEF